MATRDKTDADQRTNTIRLDPNKRHAEDLKILGDRVSRVWNAGNYLCRQKFFDKTGVPIGFKLEAEMKDTPDYRQLPSDIAQEILKKLSEAWKSYFELRAKWTANPAKSQKPGLPAYRKDRKTGTRPCDFIPIKCNRAYAHDAKDAHIVLPRDRRSKHTAGRLHMPYRDDVDDLSSTAP
jgi:putative transposase